MQGVVEIFLVAGGLAYLLIGVLTLRAARQKPGEPDPSPGDATPLLVIGGGWCAGGVAFILAGITPYHWLAAVGALAMFTRPLSALLFRRRATG